MSWKFQSALVLILSCWILVCSCKGISENEVENVVENEVENEVETEDETEMDPRFFGSFKKTRLNPNRRIVSLLGNPKNLRKKTSSLSSSLFARPRFGFGGLLTFPLTKLLIKNFAFNNALTAPTTTTTTTTTPATTTANPVSLYAARTCVEALTICPLGTRVKPIETRAMLDSLNLIGGFVFAGAGVGVANPAPPGQTAGLSFTWPSGNVISSNDNDDRWDTVTGLRTLNHQTLTNRNCLFWDNTANVRSLRGRRQENESRNQRIMVACERT